MPSVIVLSEVGYDRAVSGSKEGDNALTAFNEIVKAYPENKGFHNALQHWGLKLPTGEKFEWSKDMSANKADYAMVMLADPLESSFLSLMLYGFINRFGKSSPSDFPAGS